MKVSDKEIINAVHNCQLTQMCDSFITHYAGGSYGLTNREICEQHYIYISSMQRRKLKVDLSYKQLLVRLQSLVNSGDLYSNEHFRSIFYYGVNRTDSFNEAVEFIRDYWKGKKLKVYPGGSVELPDFDEHLAEIRRLVLTEYGKFTKCAVNGVLGNHGKLFGVCGKIKCTGDSSICGAVDSFECVHKVES